MGYYISIMHIPKEDLTQDMLEYAELRQLPHPIEGGACKSSS